LIGRSIYIGFDPREGTAFSIAKYTAEKYLTQAIPIRGLVLHKLIDAGLYTRPMEIRKSAVDAPIMWDVISEHPMSTEHANARFFVPLLAKTGWALFTDGDVMFRSNVARVFDGLDPSKAVVCVHHDHRPEATKKMDGQVQSKYVRKNWSSVMFFNCDHPANKRLTLEILNGVPGRDLHRFCWLEDDEIGELDPAWNYLVGHSPPWIDPKLVHFTEGVPDMPGYENVPYADEWRDAMHDWAEGG